MSVVSGSTDSDESTHGTVANKSPEAGLLLNDTQKRERTKVCNAKFGPSKRKAITTNKTPEQAQSTTAQSRKSTLSRRRQGGRHRANSIAGSNAATRNVPQKDHSPFLAFNTFPTPVDFGLSAASWYHHNQLGWVYAMYPVYYTEYQHDATGYPACTEENRDAVRVDANLELQTPPAPKPVQGKQNVFTYKTVEECDATIAVLEEEKRQIPGVANKRRRKKINNKIDIVRLNREKLLSTHPFEETATIPGELQKQLSADAIPFIPCHKYEIDEQLSTCDTTVTDVLEREKQTPESPLRVESTDQITSENLKTQTAVSRRSFTNTRAASAPIPASMTEDEDDNKFWAQSAENKVNVKSLPRRRCGSVSRIGSRKPRSRVVVNVDKENGNGKALTSVCTSFTAGPSCDVGVEIIKNERVMGTQTATTSKLRSVLRSQR